MPARQPFDAHPGHATSHDGYTPGHDGRSNVSGNIPIDAVP
jgi:hypothetical protein